MINQQILDYVKSQINKGIPEQEVKNALLLNGWKESDVEEAFVVVGNHVPKPPVVNLETAGPVVASANNANNIRNDLDLKMPTSMVVFELAMYLSVALSVIAICINVIKTQMFILHLMFFINMSIFIIPVLLKFFLIRQVSRKRENWARVTLTILFVFSIFNLLQLIRGLSLGYAGHTPFDSILISLGIASFVAYAVAIICSYTKSANRWLDFDMMIKTNQITQSSNVGTPVSGGEQVTNIIWSKYIPRVNRITLLFSVVAVFIGDLGFIIANLRDASTYIPFWVVMIVVLGVFYLMQRYEKNKLTPRFQYSRSSKDGWILCLICLRNIIFILNFIPFIQLMGMAGVFYGAIPYAIIYTILLKARYKEA